MNLKTISKDTIKLFFFSLKQCLRNYGDSKPCPRKQLKAAGYLLPAFLPDKLPPPLRWLVEPGGPLASKVGAGGDGGCDTKMADKYLDINHTSMVG